MQENAYLIFVRTSMKCADVEQGPSKETYNLFEIQEGMNTNLGTKEAQIREQKRLQYAKFYWGSRRCGFHSSQVNFGADRSGVGGATN